ncbi:flagellar biosynthetic protein FliQ [Thermaurantiacus sp.]
MGGEDILYDMARRGLIVLTLATLPALLAALVIGLVIGLVQAATSINEATLTFVPKLVGVALVLAAFGGIIGGLVLDFTREAIEAIPALTR